MGRVSYRCPGTARVVSLPTSRKLIVFAAAVAAALYFPWRLTTFNPAAPVLSILLYMAELFALVQIALHAFMTFRILEREAPLPLHDATVDVLVPTYNEPVEMLRRTLLAARNMKYPHETWLIDDGNRPEMAALANELGIHYLSRTNNEHAKAGNLNNALAHSSGEYIAIFDSDHVPHEDYLVRTLGYFSDPNVAFVQTPQDFYNLDSFQHRRRIGSNLVWTEQSLFFRVIMPGKDYWNAAFFCGSCATARRSAIASIGGFATETVTEDLHTSVRLHKKGYGSVYHAESLAYGIAPDTFEPYESQRIRWGQGAMQVWRRERLLTSAGLTLPQRLCYFASALTYFDGWQKAFMFFLPSFVLVTGILPIASLDWSYVLRFLPWYLVSLWACEELGRGYAASWTIEQYNFLRAPGFSLATLTFLLNRKLHFRVTKKVSTARAENVRRIAPQLAAIFFGFLSLGIGIVRFVLYQHMATGAFLFNIAWCTFTLWISLSAVRFALGHSKQDRGSYRFRLPVPMRITEPGGRTQIIGAQNISSGGCSIPKGDLAVAPGDKLVVELIIPEGTLKTVAHVQRIWASYDRPEQKILGLKFDWAAQRDVDKLDLYLYGSNAEWRLGGLKEKGQTPADWFVWRRRKRSLVGDHAWKSALVVPADWNRAIETLVADQAEGPPLILAGTILKIGAPIAVVHPDSDGTVDYYIVGSVRVDTSLGRQLFLHAQLEVDPKETSHAFDLTQAASAA
jgi:cellulose synthase/poly-beta-1,6-N-acetylglucosamine synthase-like glycosyltransferase